MADPQWIPLFLLAAILGLPALLILFTARHPMYVLWFLIYLIALPIWNFVLPAYAYWHMDDFSWGETRKVESGGSGGSGAKDDHGRAEGTFDASNIFMKRWHEFELERKSKADRFRAGERIEADLTTKDYTYNREDYDQQEDYELIEVDEDYIAGEGEYIIEEQD